MNKVILLILLITGCAIPHNPSIVGKERQSAEQSTVASTATPSLAGAAIAYDEGRYAEAFSMYRLLAEQGDVGALNGLAFMYIRGKGVPVDAAEGARLFLLAAEQGDPQSQNDLGMMYFYGESVTKNYVLAYMWLKISYIHSTSVKQNKFSNYKSIVKYMSFEEYVEAHDLIDECTANRFKECGKLYDINHGVKEA